MAKIVPPLVFRKQAEYDGKYDAVSECELRPHETFKLLRAHALQQLYIICHAKNGSLWKTISSVVSRPCLDAAQKHRQTCYVNCRKQPVNLARVA